MEPDVIRDKEAMRKWSRRVRSQGKTIGLVPTMGYLHDGHLSLVRQSLTLTDLTVVSIYVNPGQFSPTEDLSTYPSDFSGDLAKLAALSRDKVVVFNPKNLYDYGGEGKKINGRGGGRVVSCVEEGGLGHETWVRVERLEKGLCGKSRPVLLLIFNKFDFKLIFIYRFTRFFIDFQNSIKYVGTIKSDFENQ